jgi:hypothetical protein
VVVFVLYLVVLRYWAASRAAYAFVLIPFVTVVLSAWLDNEPLGPGLLLGGLLVLAGCTSAHCVPPTASHARRGRPSPLTTTNTRSNRCWLRPQLFTRQQRIVQRVLARSVLAAQVRHAVRRVRSYCVKWYLVE